MGMNTHRFFIKNMLTFIKYIVACFIKYETCYTSMFEFVAYFLWRTNMLY